MVAPDARGCHAPELAVLLDTEVVADDTVDYHQSIEAPFGEPFKNGVCEVDIVLTGELNLRGENPDTIALVDADRVLWHRVVDQCHSREIRVEHGAHRTEFE